LVYDIDFRHRVDFESDTCVRYFDFLPTHQIAERQALSGFRSWFEAQRMTEEGIPAKVEIVRQNLERLSQAAASFLRRVRRRLSQPGQCATIVCRRRSKH